MDRLWSALCSVCALVSLCIRSTAIILVTEGLVLSPSSQHGQQQQQQQQVQRNSQEDKEKEEKEKEGERDEEKNEAEDKEDGMKWVSFLIHAKPSSHESSHANL